MRERFAEHHRPSTDEFRAFWQEAIIVLDANVLLNIYRFGNEARADFFSVLERLGPRLWVPAHAVEEFYRSRVGVIRQQRDVYRQVRDALGRTRAALEGGSFARSFFVDIPGLVQAVDVGVTAAMSRLDAQERAHPDLLSDDPYLERLSGLIGTKLGDPYTGAALAAAIERARDRYDKEIPPGYADKRKTEPGARPAMSPGWTATSTRLSASWLSRASN